MRIAIDAMGGDHAPQAAVEGAVSAAKEWADITVILVGDTDRLQPLLQGNEPANLELRHASETIEADDEPVKAVRRKKRRFHGSCGPDGEGEGSRCDDFGGQYRCAHDDGAACGRPDSGHREAGFGSDAADDGRGRHTGA